MCCLAVARVRLGKHLALMQCREVAYYERKKIYLNKLRQGNLVGSRPSLGGGGFMGKQTTLFAYLDKLACLKCHMFFF